MSQRLGLFRLAGNGYAIPLERLLRVVSDTEAVSLPLLPTGMAGMLINDDEIVPLIDSDWLSGVAAGSALESTFRVLVATEFGPVAIPADETVGIVNEARGERELSETRTADFLPENFSYRNNRYRVVNIDLFIMSLIRP